MSKGVICAFLWRGNASTRSRPAQARPSIARRINLCRYRRRSRQPHLITALANRIPLQLINVRRRIDRRNVIHMTGRRMINARRIIKYSVVCSLG